MAEIRTVIVDHDRLMQARVKLGAGYVRVLGYLRDDGLKAVTIIEEAMRVKSAVAMINPAERIKSEAFDLGAIALAEMAEHIEMSARDCVEWRESPDELLQSVIALRRIFTETVTHLSTDASPLAVRAIAPLRQKIGRF